MKTTRNIFSEMLTARSVRGIVAAAATFLVILGTTPQADAQYLIEPRGFYSPLDITTRTIFGPVICSVVVNYYIWIDR